VKRRRRFHRPQKIPHSGNLGSCCAVLPLCETYDRGEHDTTRHSHDTARRVRFVKLLLHISCCARQAVVLAVRLCASRRYTCTRCMQPVLLGSATGDWGPRSLSPRFM
jgi:hypothetical protein